MNMIDCYITAVPNAIGTLANLDTMITTIEAPHLRASVLHMMIVHTCPERFRVSYHPVHPRDLLKHQTLGRTALWHLLRTR